MYHYHDDLRAPHAASSPWWAWPLTSSRSGSTRTASRTAPPASIYDAGNLVVFWMGIPALLFAALAAWRRRSLSLTVVVLLFLAMWLPWARIDRATFQYHFYTACRSWSWRSAYLARGAVARTRASWPGCWRASGAALCILGPSLMWLLRPVLCAAANTAATDAGAQVCGASVRDVALSQRSVVVLAVLVVAGVALTLALWRAYRAGHRPAPSGGRGSPRLAVGAGAGRPASSRSSRWGQPCCSPAMPSGSPSSSRPTRWVPSRFLVLLAPAWIVLRARDARRFALGLVARGRPVPAHLVPEPDRAAAAQRARDVVPGPAADLDL